MIVGCTALVAPIVITQNTLRKEIPLSILSSIVLLICANDVLLNYGAGNVISRTDGLLLLCFFAIFMGYTFAIARKRDNPDQEEDFKQLSVVRSIIYIVAGLAASIFGGDWFVKGASGIARSFGVSEAGIGLTLVAGGISRPELATSIVAALKKNPEIAIGNAIGSVTANTGMIMGISILFMPVVVKRKEYMPKSLLLIASVGILWFFCTPGELKVFGSIAMFILFAIFLIENISSAKRKLSATSKKSIPGSELRKQLILFAIGTAGIVVGSDLLVDNGSLIAEVWGVPESIIALTMVAIGTSLPELVTTITAISKKQSSLSVADIIGANIINTTLILPFFSFM